MSKKRIVLHSVNRLIDVNIDGIIISIKPPNLDEKDLYLASLGSNLLTALKAGRFLVQMCLKDIKADIHIENEEGEVSPFKLEFGSNGYVSEDCMELLGQFPIFEKLRGVVTNFSQGNPEKLYQIPPTENNPEGVLLEGVSIIKKKKKVKKK